VRKADNLPPYCAVVKKSGSLNFLDLSGPARPVMGEFTFAVLEEYMFNCLIFSLFYLFMYREHTMERLYFTIFSETIFTKTGLRNVHKVVTSYFHSIRRSVIQFFYALKRR
jgi:hypothetical protein